MGGLLASWVECEEFDLGGDLRLVRQELELLQVHDARELYDDFLRELAEFHGLPAAAVDRRVEQLGDWILRVFTATVDDPVAELGLAWQDALGAICLHMRHRLLCHNLIQI